MRIKLIGCFSTKNEVLMMERSSQIDYEFLDFSLHAFPEQLHKELQCRIDASQDYDMIIITYGRCSHAVEGLISATVPMILPKAHDCISLLLGSDLRRQELADHNPTAYYLSQGWLDYARDPYTEYLEYVDKYGEDDAKYLIQTLYGTYREAIFIRTGCDEEKLKKYRQKVKKIANFFDWQVSETVGNLTLLNAVVNRKRCQDVIQVAPGMPVLLEEGNSYADYSQF